MKAKLLKLHEDAAMPNKAYPNDFCYDCVAISEQEVAPNVWKYGLGIALQIERDLEPVEFAEYGIRKFDFSRCPVNFSFDLRPRSSIWKTGMILSNGPGTVDENYTGEISAVFYHVMPSMPRYKVGDRIGQIKLGMAFPLEFVEVQSLDSTDRGAGGYGSTGK